MRRPLRSNNIARETRPGVVLQTSRLLKKWGFGEIRLGVVAKRGFYVFGRGRTRVFVLRAPPPGALRQTRALMPAIRLRRIPVGRRSASGAFGEASQHPLQKFLLARSPALSRRAAWEVGGKSFPLARRLPLGRSRWAASC